MTAPESQTFTSDSPFVCGWTMDSCDPVLLAAESGLATRCVTAAAEILYALSGRQFGLCELTVRPCYQKCGNGLGLITWDNGILGASGFPWLPVLQGGQWFNINCACRTSCSCTKVCEVWLPGPIDSITEVKLNGSVLASNKYHVDNRRALVRSDDQCWPKCQDMAAADTEDNTWSVKYVKGRPLPEAGRSALAEFTKEFLLGCVGDKCCKLPSRVTSIQRQGVSVTLLDPMTFIDYGRTGLYSVDMWLKSVNPKGRSRGAAVLSPDIEVPRRRT